MKVNRNNTNSNKDNRSKTNSNKGNSGKVNSNKDNKRLTLWERYLTKEIGIEFKACLYFYAILFFYCVYWLCCKCTTASILHMGEMILLCYVMGYFQVFLLGNFDEADRWGAKEILAALLCSGIYMAVSFLCNWFSRNIWVSLGFAVYMMFLYVCVFLVYKSKRRIDDKKLNEDLKLFQSREDDWRDKENRDDNK